MKTPKPVIRAFTVGPIKVCGQTIYPLTMASFAALEDTGSPLIVPATEGEKAHLQDWIPTLWILTRPATDALTALRAGTLFEQADRWAAGLPFTSLRPLIEAARDTVNSALEAIEGMGDKNGSDFQSETASSSNSPSGQPPPTAGAGAQ